MRLAAALLASLLLASCIPARIDDASAGRTTRYEPAVPNFDVEAVGRPADGGSGLDLYVSVPRASLVFVRDDASVFESRFEVLVRVFERRGRDLVREVAFSDTLRADDYAATRAYEPHTLVRRIAVPPGDYVVEAILTDLEREAQALRQFSITVLPAAPQTLALAAIRLAGQRDRGAFEPLVALHLPGDLDSLRTVAVLAAGDAVDVEVVMNLLRFESDTAAAVAPNRFGVAGGALASRGVLFTRPDTLQRTRRRLQVEDEVEVLFALPALDAGVYRVEVEARRVDAGGEGEQASLVEARTFAMTDPAFPRVETLDTMIDALVYLATPDAFERLRAPGTPTERRRRFDAFWGGLIADRARAADLLDRYYSRVEEANRLFTTFKAGWKTDRGMVYIIMGAPLQVERRIEGEVWHYTYGVEAASDAFVFERLPTPVGGEGFANYVLDRGPRYDRLWRHALDRWRSGRVL